MKIWLFSDIHLPHNRYPIDAIFPTIPDADICVCPGDLVESDPIAGVQWLARYVRPRMKVVYVMGNHEFYNLESNMERVRHNAKIAAETEGIHLLDDSSTVIDGVNFLGSTLWSDFAVFAQGSLLERNRAMAAAGSAMNDFRFIRTAEGAPAIWTPQMAMMQHFQSRFWLEKAMAHHVGPNVVISHHAPHPLSIAPQFSRDLVTAGFVSDLTDLIERHRPALWFHGHTHTSFDYVVRSTRILCNPRGYRHENVVGFKPGLVIEL